MERRAFAGLVVATAAYPVIGLPDAETPPWYKQLIAREMESPDGRKRLVNAAEWALNKVERDGTADAQLYQKVSEVLVKIQERSGPLDTYDRAKHQVLLERCRAA